MNNNRTLKMVFSIFAVIGAVFLVAGIVWLVSGIQSTQNAEKVHAEIVDIIIERDRDGDIEHEVYVDYEYDDKAYKQVRLSYYSSSMYEGQEIELLVRPDKPGKPTTSVGSVIGGIIFIVLGTVFVGVGLIAMIIMGKKTSKAKKLMEQGNPYLCEW